ncbi:hypothetical protein H5410_033577 [Solanum commersonii]|uniref:Uncharacterized protein n=1 Tax=Solanum commersonii TaxID=4109 RepID=A0A9J5YR26_SOLCO|nr:hypothetical protein H5410_033577 [Solanum commersonii]
MPDPRTPNLRMLDLRTPNLRTPDLKMLDLRNARQGSLFQKGFDIFEIGKINTTRNATQECDRWRRLRTRRGRVTRECDFENTTEGATQERRLGRRLT